MGIAGGQSYSGDGGDCGCGCGPAACCAVHGGDACSGCGCEQVVASGTANGPASLEFVGPGRGSVSTATEYKYVGSGCGEFASFPQPFVSCSYRFFFGGSLRTTLILRRQLLI